MIPGIHEPAPTTLECFIAAEQAAFAAIAAAQAHYRRTLGDLRAHCPHTDLLETGWDDNLTLVGATLPVRICTTCGVEEESRNFRILTGPVTYADRRTVHAARKMGEQATVGGSRLLHG